VLAGWWVTTKWRWWMMGWVNSMLSFMAPKKVSGFPLSSLVLHVCSYHCVCEMKVRCSLVLVFYGHNTVKSSSSFCTALLFATKSKFCAWDGGDLW
jgi:hypothetical protein